MSFEEINIGSKETISATVPATPAERIAATLARQRQLEEAVQAVTAPGAAELAMAARLDDQGNPLAARMMRDQAAAVQARHAERATADAARLAQSAAPEGASVHLNQGRAVQSIVPVDGPTEEQ